MLPFWGAYTWLSGHTKLVKQEAALQIRKSIPDEDQILWKFSITEAETQLEWEHSREFEYKGEMYDVIRAETRGDTIWYWCYWDRKESKLKRELNILVANFLGPGTQNRNHERQITDFFRSLYLPSTSGEVNAILKGPDHLCMPPYQWTLSANDLMPPYPPPELG